LLCHTTKQGRDHFLAFCSLLISPLASIQFGRLRQLRPVTSKPQPCLFVGLASR